MIRGLLRTSATVPSGLTGRVRGLSLRRTGDSQLLHFIKEPGSLESQASRRTLKTSDNPFAFVQRLQDQFTLGLLKRAAVPDRIGVRDKLSQRDSPDCVPSARIIRANTLYPSEFKFARTSEKLFSTTGLALLNASPADEPSIGKSVPSLK